MKILKQLECCSVYFRNNSQTTLYSELHCHSYQLVLWTKRRTPSKPTDGCSVLAHPDSLQMLGASSKWNTTGALHKDCEEPHHGIDALLPVEAQSNVSSLIPTLHLHVLASSH